MAIDQTTLDQLIGQFVTDFGAAMHAATVVIGDKLGLYKALAEHGPLTGAQLAEQTGFDTRLVEEWCSAQVVSGTRSGTRRRARSISPTSRQQSWPTSPRPPSWPAP
jgi:hypothetical protein